MPTWAVLGVARRPARLCRPQAAACARPTRSDGLANGRLVRRRSGHVNKKNPANRRRWRNSMGILRRFRQEDATCPPPDRALPGRSEAIPTASTPFRQSSPAARAPIPRAARQAVFGLGCFWGAEKAFWKLDGVYVTAVGYAGGNTPNPTYQEVCSGMTGHNEVVLVVYDPKKISLRDALQEVLRGARPDAGHAPGQRHRHPVPLRHLRRRRRPSGRSAEAVKAVYGKELDDARLRADHHRDRRPAALLLRRGLSPAVSRQEPATAIAGSAAPACPARSVSPPPNGRHRSGQTFDPPTRRSASLRRVGFFSAPR